MAQIRLTVLVGDASRDRYPEVVENCRRIGFIVEDELVSIGVITGCIEEALVPALAGVEGVSAVEPQRKHHGFS